MKRFVFSILLVFAVVIQASAQGNRVEDGLALKYLVQLPSEKSAKPPVVILLHGYGGDEQNLFDLRRFFPKNFVIIAARAPSPVPGAGYQWFERARGNGTYTPRQDQIESSRKLVVKFVSQIVGKYHADAASVYVMGFSQGAIMSYEAGLTSPQTIRGIGVLSGLMPESLKPLIKPSPALSKLRIFVAHGTADGVLPYTDGKAGSDYLVSLGLKPEFHTYKEMGHSISKEVIDDVVKWLK